MMDDRRRCVVMQAEALTPFRTITHEVNLHEDFMC